MAEALFTTSWDDGAPEDLRLAELLSRHGVGATFYVPGRNGEGRPVLAAAELRALAAGGFEIGGHGLDHIRLSGLTLPELRHQVFAGKAMVEDRLGAPLFGFCYPGGRGVRQAAPHLREAGYAYARTTRMFLLNKGSDPYARPTSLQLFPHGAPPLLRNWVRQGPSLARLALALRCLSQRELDARIERLMQEVLRHGGLLHLWGHSWEIEALELWPLLDRILARAAVLFPQSRRVCNALAFRGG